MSVPQIEMLGGPMPDEPPATPTPAASPPSGSSICPSVKALVGEGHAPLYQCVTVMVFWNDSAVGAHDGKPNVDRFYLHNYPLNPWSMDLRTGLEELIKSLIQAAEGNAVVNRVAYLSHAGFPLTDEQVQAEGWHFISGEAPAA